MYNCERCGRTTSPGEKTEKVIIKVKIKEYENILRVPTDNPRRREYMTKRSKGYEIVKEEKMCLNCLKDFIENGKVEGELVENVVLY